MKMAIALVLLLAAPVFGFIGYQKAQPTALEGLASGMASFAKSVDPNARRKMEDQIEAVKGEQIKRGIPFYGGALFSGLCGIGLIASGAKKEG